MGKTPRRVTRFWKREVNEKKRLRIAYTRNQQKLGIPIKATGKLPKTNPAKKTKVRAVGKTRELPITSTPIVKSEPNLVESEPNLVESEPNLVESEPNLVESEPNLFESEPNLFESEPNLFESEPLNLTPINRQVYEDTDDDRPIDLTILKTDSKVKTTHRSTALSKPTTMGHHQNPIVLPYCMPKFPTKTQYVNLVKPYAIKYPRPETPTTNGDSPYAAYPPQSHPIPSPAHAVTFSRPGVNFGAPPTMPTAVRPTMPRFHTVYEGPTVSSNDQHLALPWTTCANNNIVANPSTSIRYPDVATTEMDIFRSSLFALQTQRLFPFMFPFLNPSLLSIASNDRLGFGIPDMLQPTRPPIVNPNVILPNAIDTTASDRRRSICNDDEVRHDDAILENAAKLIILPNGDTFFVHPHYGLHKLPQTMTLDKIELSPYSKNKVRADYFGPEFLELFADNQVVPSLNTDETTTRREQRPLPPESKEYRFCVQHLRRLLIDDKIPLPECNCDAKEEYAPSYANLGSGSSLVAIQELMERRTGVKESAIRIEKVIYGGVEAQTPDGCPLANHVLRRTGLQEKFLILVRNRPFHKCRTAWIIVAIVAWDGVHPSMADRLYNSLSSKLADYGMPRKRGCEQNDDRTCACQGTDLTTRGISLSFGCSYSTYYDSCKYTRSTSVHKFKLSEESQEQEVEELLQNLATKLAPVYQKLAPYAYANQVLFEESGFECRLGRKAGRPWSGVTTCLDFCAHAHKDVFDMLNGSTAVVTLTKHRGFEKVDDEQLHVLPMYTMDSSDLGPGVEVREKESAPCPVPCQNPKTLKRQQKETLRLFGGVAIALTHGSLLFECARHELHASTALKSPNRANPTRLSLVFYQHKRLNSRHHGFMEYQLKSQEKTARAREGVEAENGTDRDTNGMRKKVKQPGCKKL